MAEIKAPVFPESVADGTIVEWHFAEGDQVSRDAVLAEIETDKVVLEVVAQTDGVLSKIVKNVDDTVLSAEVIGELTEGATAAPKADAPKAEDKADANTTVPPESVAPLFKQKQMNNLTKTKAQPYVKRQTPQVSTLLMYKAQVVAVVLPNQIWQTQLSNQTQVA